MSWLRLTADGAITLTLHIQPGAKRTEFAGLHGDALKIRLAAPPLEGRANACLIEFMADFCGLAKRDVSLLSGESSRHKVLRIEACRSADSAALHARLLALSAAPVDPVGRGV